ncbi:DUF6777 domain-containing protein [Streptomyces goshikiensis]|uniref:DUF6777 domain-containing protein n=1 Tax=Streptomyces goshikiensis TaxID=1942 RepID=UPI003D9F21D2
MEPSGQEPPRRTSPSHSSQPRSERPTTAPTGPPSGPLSGGQGGGQGAGQSAGQGVPPPPPPPAPPGGPGGSPGPSGTPEEPGGRPWWRSGPRLATVLVALAAVVALVVVLTRPSGKGDGGDTARGEVFLQPAAATGPDPFTESTAAKGVAPPPQTPPPEGSGTPTAARETGATVTRSVSGDAAGVFGGTRDIASCDVEKQITVLSAQPSKNGAFAQALGIRPETVPGYLRSLTPVQLALDTRVTNHGYRSGKGTEYQAVLQAGTAVMVDDRGVPRVRCACGNPLGPPVPLTANPERHGRPWSSYQPAKAVAIAPAAKTVDKFVIYDHRSKQWYERGRGFRENAQHDKPVPPPRVVPKPPWPPGTPTRTWNPGDKTSQPPPPQPRTSPPTKAPRTGEPPSGKTSSEGTPSRSPDGGPRSEPPSPPSSPPSSPPPPSSAPPPSSPAAPPPPPPSSASAPVSPVSPVSPATSQPQTPPKSAAAQEEPPSLPEAGPTD